MRPKEFWRLHPKEFFWLADSVKPVTMYGSMTEAEVEELYEDAYGEEA